MLFVTWSVPTSAAFPIARSMNVIVSRKNTSATAPLVRNEHTNM